MSLVNSSAARIRSIDILRGICVALMIFLNNPGDWAFVYEPLEHAPWNGITPTDLVFPCFIFVMGITLYISLRKGELAFSSKTFKKMLRRSILLFLLGMSISWLGNYFTILFNFTKHEAFTQRAIAAFTQMEDIRIPGVLQRLAVCSLMGYFVAVLVPVKHWLKLAFAILLLYYIILFIGNGYELSSNNIIVRIDTLFLGPSHIYTGKGIPFDPEGLLSNMPCIAQIILGLYAGKMLTEKMVLKEKLLRLLKYGALLGLAGLALSFYIPFNKNIWSPTFVLFSSFTSIAALVVLTWVVTPSTKSKWCTYFEAFGVNALFLYLLGEFISAITETIVVNLDNRTDCVKGFIFNTFREATANPYIASILYSAIFLIVFLIIGMQLYKRRIFIKL